MNQQAQQELLKWLSELREQAERGLDFAVTQAPSIVQDKIRLGRIEETATSAFFLSLIIGSLLLVSYGYKQEDEDLGAACFLIGALAGLAGILGSMFSMHATLTVWFAPRIYIIEWLRTLVG